MGPKIERRWYYWGCVGDAGHALYEVHRPRSAEPYLRRAPYRHFFACFDGTLCGPESLPMQVSVVRFTSLGFTALAFPDLTGDSRGGSNSTIFAPSATVSAKTIIDGLERFLPGYLWKRWPAFDLSRVEYQALVSATAQSQQQG